MNDNKNDNGFGSLLKGLQESADGFLKNLNQATSANEADNEQARQERKDRYKELEKTVFGDNADAFERVYRGVREKIADRPERVLPAHEEIPNLPEQKIHVHDNRVAQQQTSAPQTPDVPVVAVPVNGSELMGQMSSLLQDMTTTASPAADFSWHALDQLSGSIRKAWVSVLAAHSSTPNPQSGAWLDRWEQVVQLVAQSVDQWPKEHQDSWAAWAETGQKEVNALRPLLAQSATNNFLSVPAAFQGKGVIPAPPSGTPKELVQDLQHCSDFFEFYQSSENVRWKNTPSKYAFEECKGKMEQWSPQSAALSEWKERALDRYTLIEAKIAVKGAGLRTSIAPTRAPKA